VAITICLFGHSFQWPQKRCQFRGSLDSRIRRLCLLLSTGTIIRRQHPRNALNATRSSNPSFDWCALETLAEPLQLLLNIPINFFAQHFVRGFAEEFPSSVRGMQSLRLPRKPVPISVHAGTQADNHATGFFEMHRRSSRFFERRRPPFQPRMFDAACHAPPQSCVTSRLADADGPRSAAAHHATHRPGSPQNRRRPPSNPAISPLLSPRRFRV